MLAIRRRAAGLCLLLVMSACGDEPRSLPTAPTVPNLPSPGRLLRSRSQA